MGRQLCCYDCGTVYDTGQKRCDCGEPLWFVVEPAAFEWPEPDALDGVWRYAAVLPVAEPVGIGSGAGATPTYRANRLDEYAGCVLSLKHEGQNPTGSFKDRGSAVGIGEALGTDLRWVGTVSHGNMALSMSAQAASAGLGCVVFVPADTPEERLDLIARHDPKIFRVTGDYGRLYEETLSSTADVAFVNSDTPLRVAGQKTVAYELCEEFAPAVPDAIALPVSSGGQASAVWKALLELDRAGAIDAVPCIYLVQAAACDPIAAAYRGNESEVTAVDAEETIAVSIANADPPSGTRALTAARETGGAVVSVPDAAIEDAMVRLSETAGLSVEPASATALAGIRELSRLGTVDEHDEVAAILTGTGYKERCDAGTAESRSIELDELDAELAAVVE